MQVRRGRDERSWRAPIKKAVCSHASTLVFSFGRPHHFNFLCLIMFTVTLCPAQVGDLLQYSSTEPLNPYRYHSLYNKEGNSGRLNMGVFRENVSFLAPCK